MARIGWSGLARPAWLKAAAARFRCRLGRGHIVSAARLQLVDHCHAYRTVQIGPISKCIILSIFCEQCYTIRFACVHVVYLQGRPRVDRSTPLLPVGVPGIDSDTSGIF